jgi:phospholipid/cholesterol/gamma-HCH transport system permease protein
VNAVAERVGRCELRRADDSITLVFTGDWTIAATTTRFAEIRAQLTSASPRELGFDMVGLRDWDSTLVVWVLHCKEYCRVHSLTMREEMLPEGVRRLMALALAVAPESPQPLEAHSMWRSLLSGRWLYAWLAGSADSLAFVGEVVIALGRLVRGRANTRLVDFFYFVQQAGPAAIGIITLISVLVGMILAYLGVVQLAQFGAQIYVADLVGIGMVREMGALMTAVIMSGRTGAAYAAQLGTMQTREEIDAINTLGIAPIEFLVLPRILALVVVMPMLCIYSDALGMLGGAIVARGMDVSFTQYWTEMQTIVTMTHISVGVVKSVVFGLLIAISGCRAGIRCGRSSEAVGQAATTAVVTAIVYLIVADAAFNIVFQNLGI